MPRFQFLQTEISGNAFLANLAPFILKIWLKLETYGGIFTVPNF